MTVTENPVAELVALERFRSPAMFEAEMTQLWGKLWRSACRQ